MSHLYEAVLKGGVGCSPTCNGQYIPSCVCAPSVPGTQFIKVPMLLIQTVHIDGVFEGLNAVNLRDKTENAAEN